MFPFLLYLHWCVLFFDPREPEMRGRHPARGRTVYNFRVRKNVRKFKVGPRAE